MYYYSVLLSYDCDLFGKNQANYSNDNLLYKTRYEFTPTANNSYIKYEKNVQPDKEANRRTGKQMINTVD